MLYKEMIGNHRRYNDVAVYCHEMYITRQRLNLRLNISQLQSFKKRRLTFLYYEELMS